MRRILLLGILFALGFGIVKAQDLSKRDPVLLFENALELLSAGEVYKASDVLEQALTLNPAYADAWALLARCQYELGEYERAVGFIDEAFKFGAKTPALVCLKGFGFLGLGRLDEARKAFEETVLKIPKDRDARFGLALLDLNAGKSKEAKAKLSESLASYPTDPRALLSLATIARAENKNEEASAFLKEALRWLGDDAEVNYAAAELYAEQGNKSEAIRLARIALTKQAKHSGASKLLALISFEEGFLEEARGLLESVLQSNRNDAEAWFLLALIEQAAKNRTDAEYAFKRILALHPEDELARIALENFIMDMTAFEDPARLALADWHFSRAKDFERSYLNQKAIAEYRRGLAINPYANAGRRRYAELLRSAGLSNSYLAELRFLDGIGKADTALKDAIEIYDSLLSRSISQDWAIAEPSYAYGDGSYNIGIFSLSHGSFLYHPGSDAVFARYFRDMLVFEPLFNVRKQVPAVNSPSDAYQLARQSALDYYVIVSLAETERNVMASLELRSGKTGAIVKRINAPRSGNDKVALAAFYLLSEIKNTVELKASLVARKGNLGLVNLGKSAMLQKGDSFLVIKKGAVSISSDGKALSWKDEDIVATITADKIDDDYFEGKLVRIGFFDRINPGDVVVRKPEEKKNTEKETTSIAGLNWSLLYERLRRLY